MWLFRVLGQESLALAQPSETEQAEEAPWLLVLWASTWPSAPLLLPGRRLVWVWVWAWLGSGPGEAEGGRETDGSGGVLKLGVLPGWPGKAIPSLIIPAPTPSW